MALLAGFGAPELLGAVVSAFLHGKPAFCIAAGSAVEFSCSDVNSG